MVNTPKRFYNIIRSLCQYGAAADSPLLALQGCLAEEDGVSRVAVTMKDHASRAMLHEHGALLGYGPLVMVLVAVHLAAFVFWLCLLYRSSNSKPNKKVATD